MKEYVASSAYSGWNNLGAAIGGLKGTDLRWANPLELKNAVENAFTEKFGTKEASKPKGKVGSLQAIICGESTQYACHRNPRKKPLRNLRLRPNQLLPLLLVPCSPRVSLVTYTKLAGTLRSIHI